jgi:hypothetical protein
MLDFDTFARSMVRHAPPRRDQARSRQTASVLSWAIPLGCALLPLGVMVQAYLLTA